MIRQKKNRDRGDKSKSKMKKPQKVQCDSVRFADFPTESK